MTRPHAVLVCGQLLTAEVWAPVIAAGFARVNLAVADHTRDPTVGEMAARLLHEAPAAFHLAGHAMGGFVALEVMRRAPERVLSLALLASAASADGPAQTERRRGYIAQVQAGGFEKMVDERVPTLVHPARREDAPLLVAARCMALQTGPEVFTVQQRAIMSRPDSRPSLGAIACPTLLLAGREDPFAPPDQQEELHASISGSRLETVDHCGHLLTLERPRTVARLLLDWMTS